MWITQLTLATFSLLCLYRVSAPGIHFPIYNWPLHELAKVYETMEGVAQNTTQAGLNYEDPLYNNVKTLSLDGTNYIDINVGTHAFGDKDDYTFTFYMSPKQSHSEPRCLLDYVSNDGSIGITSVRITITDDDMLVSRTLAGSVTEQSTFTDIVAFTQWQLFSVAVDNSQGKCSVIVHDSSKTEISGWQKEHRFNTPGLLRIGGCFNTSLPKFGGSITCLSLFDKKLSENDLDDVEAACEDSTFVCHASNPELTAVLNSQTCPSMTTSQTLTDSTTTSQPLTDSTTMTSQPLTDSTTMTSQTLTDFTTMTSQPLTDSTTMTSQPLTDSTTTTSQPLTDSTTMTSQPLTDSTTTTSQPLTDSTTTTSQPLTDSTSTSSQPLTVSTNPSSQQPPFYFNTARYTGNEVTILTYLMTADLVPDPNLQAYVATYPGCSLYQCGARCMMDDTCTSFSLEEISEGLGTCRIYDVILSTGLVVLLQSGYYARQ